MPEVRGISRIARQRVQAPMGDRVRVRREEVTSPANLPSGSKPPTDGTPSSGQAAALSPKRFPVGEDQTRSPAAGQG